MSAAAFGSSHRTRAACGGGGAGAEPAQVQDARAGPPASEVTAARPTGTLHRVARHTSGGRRACSPPNSGSRCDERLPRNGESRPRREQRLPRSLEDARRRPRRLTLLDERPLRSRERLVPSPEESERSVVGGNQSRERRSGKSVSVCQRVPTGALGSSRRARRSERLPFQLQQTPRRERGGLRDTQRRSRPPMRAARREEMCHGHEGSRIDRSVGGAPRSLGGARRSLGGARRDWEAPARPREATGAIREDVAASSDALFALRDELALPRSPATGGRASRPVTAPRPVRARSVLLLLSWRALRTVGRPRRDERGARHPARGALCASGGARRSGRRSRRAGGVARHAKGGAGLIEGGSSDVSRRGPPVA